MLRQNEMNKHESGFMRDKKRVWCECLSLPIINMQQSLSGLRALILTERQASVRCAVPEVWG